MERVLAGYLEKANDFPALKRQIMAVRYYLAYVIKVCQAQWEGVHLGITNYRTLVSEIERWRDKEHGSVYFVTFNYDTMLEDACLDIGLRFDTFHDYISRDNYKVFKLHGSVNWGRYTSLSLSDLKDTTQWGVANEAMRRADIFTHERPLDLRADPASNHV